MEEIKDVLTRKFAQKRKKQIGDISYGLFLKFESKSKKYFGKCKIKFEIKDKEEDIVLESISNIKKVLVNGKKAKYERGDFFLKLNDGLEIGKNEIEIGYEADYSHTGAGLHQFIDPEDGKEYLYSHFEPYDAHKLFPCFDQPDLKATLKLEVEIPKEWISVSNEHGVEKINRERKTIVFNETKKLSTYLFEIAAGNYDFVEDSHKGMKMRIYFRKSLKKYVPHQDMFKITKQGLDFYEKFFDYKYPFSKYDQIFVPEFNHGAMEQPGAVTFTEHYLVRRSMTRTERANFAITIIHEMGHMWFGDLVTMKWWDDLWLNESFADLMGYFVLVKSTEFNDAWENFYARKAWAYTQDQYSTTHPVIADAEDTDIAFSNFDGISYGKGASSLKQLMFYIGEENFRNGLREYFKKYEWSNTELNDFLECMEKSSKTNLKKWFESWIKTTGVNSITPEISLKDGKISSFKIIQNPSKSNNLLREHKTKVAMFYEKDNIIKEVFYKGKETTIKDFEGKLKPDLIFLNYEDYDYAKDRFDSESLKFVLENIGNISDNLLKQMVYGSLWQMVRDAELNPKTFLDLILKNSEKESNLFSLERMLLRAKVALNFYIHDKYFPSYCDKFFSLSLKMLDSEISKEMKNAWFGMLLYASVGIRENKFEKLPEILDGKIRYDNFEFDQDKKWAIVARLHAVGHEESREFLEKEKRADKSDKGEKMAAIAEASDIKNKEKFWKMFVSGEGKSVDFLREAMSGFYWKNQKKELRKYIPLFFENVKDIFVGKDKYYAKAFFGSLFPLMYPEKEILEEAKFFLKNHGDSNKLLKKDVMEGIDDLERAIKILEKYE